MTIKTTTHLNFRGNAKAALEFYQAVFGGDITLVSYQDAGAVQDPAEAGQIMWGQVASAEGFAIMAYDVPSRMGWNAGEIPLFISVRGNDQAELTQRWERLVDGGTVIQPLAPSGWTPLYGMVRDKFGITWVMDIEVAYAG